MNNLKETTTRIYEVDNDVYNRWAKSYGVSKAELFHMIVNEGNRIKRRKLYESMPMRTNYKKPLSGCKIDKKKVCIQK